MTSTLESAVFKLCNDTGGQQCLVVIELWWSFRISFYLNLVQFLPEEMFPDFHGFISGILPKMFGGLANLLTVDSTDQLEL